MLSLPGHELSLRACLNWLARAMRDQNELEASLQLCRQAIALEIGPQAAPPILDRLNEVQILLELGDHEAEAGEATRAHAWFQDALRACCSLRADLATGQQPILEASRVGMECVILERLDRIDEARAAAQACDRLRELLRRDGRQWPDAENAARFHLYRARLLVRTGRGEEAMALVHTTLQVALASEGEGIADLYRLAADIAQRAGRHEQASAWLHGRADALVTARRSRRASTVAILAAELSAETLRGELGSARHTLRDALAENAGLRRRLDQLVGSTEPTPPAAGHPPRSAP